jgi:RND family efflux transporter MFP subunit
MSSRESETMTGFQPAEARIQRGSIGSFNRQGRPRRSRMVLAIVAFAGFAILIYSGIHSRVEAERRLEEKVRSSATRLVVVIHPQAHSSAQEIELPGTTEAFTEAPIYARTSGYLKQWYLDIGSHAKQGQLLAEIETPELDQQLQQAESELRTAQANLQLAQVTANRWLFLLKTNVISKQETDQAVSDLNAKRATADSAEANVRRLKKLQEFEHVYAPFDGDITARNTDIGALIQNGDNTGPKELFHLAAIDKLRVFISVPEVYAGAAKSSEVVTLTLDAFPGETFTGTLARNSSSIDLTSRTLKVEVDVDNPTGRLLPGAYAFVHLKIPATAGAVTLPTNTLLFRSEGLRAAVVRHGQAKLVPITIGHDYGSTVEVISGLRASDAVIIDPSDSVTDGSPVEIVDPAQISDQNKVAQKAR